MRRVFWVVLFWVFVWWHSWCWFQDQRHSWGNSWLPSYTDCEDCRARSYPTGRGWWSPCSSWWHGTARSWSSRPPPWCRTRTWSGRRQCPRTRTGRRPGRGSCCAECSPPYFNLSQHLKSCFLYNLNTISPDKKLLSPEINERLCVIYSESSLYSQN